MDYDYIEAHSLYSVEQTMTRYCTITDREYAVSWKHIPSYWLERDFFKLHVN